MKYFAIFLIISIGLILGFFAFYEKPTISGKIIEEQNGKMPELYFCPKDNCIDVLVDIANKSSKVECAIYNIKSEKFLNILEEKKAKVVTDRDYEKNLKGRSIEYKIDKYHVMHNKFCIFDDSAVFTGSFNIVENKDDNNVLVVYSKNLAKNYALEFDELWNGKYAEKTKNPKINVNGISFESYFCPEDGCANKVIDAIKNAKESVVFMTFSFTHDKIADELIKKKNEGLKVRGIVEKGQITKDSVYNQLNLTGIDIIPDRGKELMHHKVFIIDNDMVITGSMNPTKNGDTSNDENILIVHNKYAAQRFIEEFERLKNK